MNLFSRNFPNKREDADKVAARMPKKARLNLLDQQFPSAPWLTSDGATSHAWLAIS